MGTITGSNGSDTLTGTSGSDIINSGNGDDIVNGGAGSDQLNGGAGNDTLIYTVSENLGGYKDVYTGGSGIDTVRLQLSFAEWNDPAVRLELERYVKFLSTVKTNPQGEVSNGSASDFVFNFGTSTLTVQMMEKLAVWVKPELGGDYAQVDYLTSLVTGSAAGTAVEAGGVGNSDQGTPTVSGQLKSDDLNGVDNLFQAVGAGKAATYGTYSVSADGVWAYTLNNADTRVQELAANEILSDSFAVTTADGAVKVIKITIVGSNDAPMVSGQLSSTAQEGNAAFAMNLLAGASDADHGDSAALVVANVTYTVDGVAASGLPAGISLAGGTLSVDPANAAFDHLAVGEHATIVVSYDVKDKQGATVAQHATITINGTNDAPVVNGVLTLGENEGEGFYELNLLNGASDVDHGETASLSVADVTYSVDGSGPSGSAPAGVALVGNKLNVDSSHSVFSHLAVGEQTTIVVSYNVKDIHGAAVAQVATITINGTNDTPKVSAALASTAAEGTGAYSMNLLAGASDADDGETGSLVVADVSYSVDGGASSATAPAGVSLAAATLNVDPTNAIFNHLAVGDQSTIVVSYNVVDVHGAMAPQSATVTVTGTNDAPVVSTALSSTAAEGTSAYSMNLLVGASDADDSETASLVVADVSYSVDGEAGTMIAPAGISLVGATLSVDPTNAIFNHLAVGDESTIVVSYNVVDVHGAMVAQGATVTVTGTNDAPVVSAALSSTTAEGTATYSMNLLTGASDADDGETASLVVADVSYSVDGEAGTMIAPAGISLVGATLSVDPTNAIFNHLAVGEDSTIVVSYNVVDVHGAMVAQSATVTVTGTNDAPVVSAALSSTAAEGAGAYSMDLLAGASDADDGETASLVVADVSYSVDGEAGTMTAPAGISLAGATLSVDPTNAIFNHLAVGEDSTIVVSYNVVDVHGAMVAQSATVTVTGTNDAPVVSAALSSTAAEGAGSYSMNLLAGASDADDGETGSLAVADVSYSVDGGASSATAPAGVSMVGATLNVDPTNAIFNHLAVGDQSTIVVSYNVVDVHGVMVAQSATVTVTGTNDAPVVSAALASTAAEGSSSYSLNLLAGASDADSGETATLSVAGVSYAVDGGPMSSSAPTGVSLVGSTLNVDPSNNVFNHLAVGAHSTIVVSYNVVDAQGVAVAQSAVITVTGTNDAPVVSGPVLGLATEDGATVTLNALANASDPDDGAALTVVSVPGALPAGVSYNAGTHSFTLDPGNAAYQSLAAGETADVVVGFGVSDGIASVSETVKFTVTGTNDAPVLNIAATPALANAVEDAGAPIGAVGTLVSNLVNLNPPVGGMDNVTDADSGAQTGIALTGTNAANGTWWYSTNGGANWLAVGSVSNASALLLAADANSRVYFQADSDFSGSISDGLTFRAWDGTSGTAGSKVSTAINGGTSAFSTGTDTAGISVVAVNDAPGATADRIIVSTNTIVQISTSALLGNDTDIDGYALTIQSVSGANGISGLSLDAATGTISFTSGNTVGQTAGSFQYTVWDGAGGVSTATVTIDARAVTTAADTIDLGTASPYQVSFINSDDGGDNVKGGVAGDIFLGGGAGDTLRGAVGNDLLAGGDGNDDLFGDGGNDILRGGTGNDKLDGGAGSEDMLDFSDGISGLNLTLVQSTSSTNTSGAAGLGNDMYLNMEGVIGTGLADIINGSAGNDVIRGGAGNDALDGKGGSSDLLDFSDGTQGITFTLTNNAAGSFNGSAAGLGSDTYTGFEGVIGTAFADNLTGSSLADQLRGGGGNDLISGLAGDDRIVGGNGADTLTGGTGRDTFVFDSAPNAVDSIADFNASGSAASGDWIELSLSSFSGITTAAGNLLSSSEFAASTGGGASDAVAAGVRVIYDSTTGNLYYDSDGLGAANRTLFATLTLENPADTFDQSDIRIGS